MSSFYQYRIMRYAKKQEGVLINRKNKSIETTIMWDLIEKDFNLLL